MGKLCIYFIKPKTPKRWFEGDQKIRMAVKWLIGKRERVGGVEKVYLNLCKGLDNIGIAYNTNLPFEELQEDDIPIVLGLGTQCLQGYNRPNPIIAGIALMTNPSEWPDLFEKYPVKVYLQHSEWAANIYKKYFVNRCDVWPVGIDTRQWQPASDRVKDIDVLVYNKIRFDKEIYTKNLFEPISGFLQQKSLRIATLHYGNYEPEDFVDLLHRSKSMIFLCEHESQGIAYQEALSMNVPIFAWDNGKCLDSNRFKWGYPEIDATSVPYFDERCGRTFKDMEAFYKGFENFWSKVVTDDFKPREYVLENLTLEISARRMLDIINKWIKKADEDITDG